MVTVKAMGPIVPARSPESVTVWPKPLESTLYESLVVTGLGHGQQSLTVSDRVIFEKEESVFL